ncbi:MAG: hypothetical protein ACE15E_08430 [Acidobacteriota bacterium]
MNISPETKYTERCALIWFAISSQPVFDALKTGRFGELRRLGVKVDEQAFRDIYSLVSEKPQYLDALQTVHEMWMIQCSPPPCSIADSTYESVMRELQNGLRPAHRKA